jgi:hypothetical protein
MSWADARCCIVSHLGHEMSQTNPSTLAHWPTPPSQSSAGQVLASFPPGYHVHYSAPHDQHAELAFTESSIHPSLALWELLHCILHSVFLHDQGCEPLMADDYSKYVLRQIANLQGCPAIDFSSTKKSLLTLFVGKSGRRPCCLICGKSRGSIPRTLGCVRSHLQLKPFRCGGCQLCNDRNGFVHPACISWLFGTDYFYFYS